MYDADRSKIGEPAQLDMAQLPELVIEALPPAENGKPETGGRVVKILQPGTLDEATAQEAMQRGTFVAITIQDVPVRGADLVDIVKHYVAASKLTAVHVRNCGLAVPGGQHIARTMADLSCLYSEGNRIRDGGMNTVAAALANNASLRVLGLVNEGITLKGAMVRVHCTTLTPLTPRLQHPPPQPVGSPPHHVSARARGAATGAGGGAADQHGAREARPAGERADARGREGARPRRPGAAVRAGGAFCVVRRASCILQDGVRAQTSAPSGLGGLTARSRAPLRGAGVGVRAVQELGELFAQIPLSRRRVRRDGQGRLQGLARRPHGASRRLGDRTPREDQGSWCQAAQWRGVHRARPEQTMPVTRQS